MKIEFFLASNPRLNALLAENMTQALVRAPAKYSRLAPNFLKWSNNRSDISPLESIRNGYDNIRI